MDFAQLMSFHSATPLELVFRGSVMYWFLFLLFRFVLRRDMGSLGVADVLFIVIVADAAQNGMAGAYDTVAEGMVLVATLAAWNYALDWGSYRFRLVQRLTEPEPLLLIRSGRILRRNLRHEFLTVDDLWEQLREKGVDDISMVRQACMEADGSFSILLADSGRPRGDRAKGAAGLK
jgi:uncharacterized membrane protein YcaP (DUF421 family)